MLIVELNNTLLKVTVVHLSKTANDMDLHCSMLMNRFSFLQSMFHSKLNHVIVLIGSTRRQRTSFYATTRGGRWYFDQTSMLSYMHWFSLG